MRTHTIYSYDSSAVEHFCSQALLTSLFIHSLGAWIVTGGKNAGVIKHVGKAVRDYGTERNCNSVVCIGIAKLESSEANLLSEVDLQVL